jgi:hypothetical protein
MLGAVRPRLPQKTSHLFALLGFAALLSACAANTGGGYNPTTPRNTLDPEALTSSDMKTLVITSVNLGSPSRKYLQKEEARVDARVADALQNAGYKIMPSREFSQRWNNAILTYGNPIDPTTGRVNTNSFIQIMQTVKQQMLEQTNVDGFVFTDLLEKDVVFTSGMTRVARWDGVTRKPSLEGPGQGVTAEFDWARPAAAATIRIAIFNRDLVKVFDGAGGMDMTDAVDTRSGLDFVRRRDILENENFIDEGIAIALHPFIPMENWPGNNPDEK